MTKDPKTPVEVYEDRRFWIVRAIVLLVIVLIGAFVYWRYIAQTPVDYASDFDHFKYGSIGSDSDSGIPYWIWRVMPAVCAGHLPDPAAFGALPVDEQTGWAGTASSGFSWKKAETGRSGFRNGVST